MNEVTVVVPTWNRADLVVQSLANLAAQSRGPDRVLIVDNGSTDDTVSLATQAGAAVLALGRNIGFAGAVNAGIEQTTTDWVLILNNDVVLAENWLEVLLAAAIESGADFATGKLLQGSDVNRIDGTWDTVSRAGHAWRTGYGRLDGPEWGSRRKVEMAPMTAALFRRNLFDRFGLLDTRFEAYYEDVDFGIRCAAQGASGVFEPAAVGRHLGKVTLGKRSERVAFLSARNQIFLLAKHCPASYLRRFWWPVVIGQALGVFGSAANGATWADLRGKWEGLRRWKEFRAGRTDSESAATAMLRSEQELFRLQSRLGFDPYWRLYFKLILKPLKELTDS